MEKSPEMLRLEKDLNASEELREKLNLEIERIAKSGEAKCDGEVMVKAAAALGYQLSISELEQAQAEMQELDLEEMDAVAGGFDENRQGEECFADYTCMCNWNTKNEDENGHNAWCVTVWHCHVISMHTETNSKKVTCFTDYLCEWLLN